MSGKYFCIAILLSFCATTGIAQTDSSLHIRLASSRGNDSLWLTATLGRYQEASSLMVIATLANSHLTDTIFLPLVDSESVFCLITPPGTNEDLMIRGYFYPKIFAISGHLNARRKQPNIRVMLLTDNNAFYNKEIVLNEENNFKLPPMVFEKKATLVFNYLDSRNSKDHPDIILNAAPYASYFNELIFNDTIRYHVDTSNIISRDSLSTIVTAIKTAADARNYITMKEVNVKGKLKTKLEKFNDTYSTGLFNDLNARIIDCLEDESILSSNDCISFLQARVPGLSQSRGEYGTVQLKWRGAEVNAFYIDEIQVNIEELLSLSTADIAMIKTYPPPFSGSTDGGGGAIAVYTRRGEYRRPNANENKWLFTIKGYSPSMYILFGGK